MKKKYNLHSIPLWAALLCLGLVACDRNWSKSFSSPHESETASADTDPFVAVFRKLRPSIAMVTVEIVGRPGIVRYGTASVVKSDRRGTWLLTAAHVIADARAAHVRIGMHPLGLARLTARDTINDVAILYVSPGNLPVAKFGSSSHLEAGMPIGIAGYPVPDAFADEHLAPTPSVYSGRIASVRSRMLEIDAPIIPGDSGGPVFDADTGLIIGMSEERIDDERAIGLATPINRLKPFLHRALPKDAQAN
jgi:S1-C subfamily serine protease